MNIRSERSDQLRREFSNESYMNPDPNSTKYQGRDAAIGKREAERRRKFLPEIGQRSQQVLSEMAIDTVVLLPKGSVAVNMSLPTSDLDIAVVVEPGHIFTKRSDLWRTYKEKLAEQEGVDFQIQPRLVIKKDRLGGFLSKVSKSHP